MKFGKLLQSSTAELPEMGNMFLRYKELKKQLKSIAGGKSQSTDDLVATANAHEQGTPSDRPAVKASDFLKTLHEDLSRFNQFYMEKEEECVIKLHSLSERANHAITDADMHVLKAELVELHGEMVLLLHWSMLNYAAVMKILKKHDKCTGLLLKRPYQPLVLMQPFSSTSIMSGLIKDAEALMLKLIGTPTPASCPGTAPASRAASCAGTSPTRQQLQQLQVDEQPPQQQQQQEAGEGQQVMLEPYQQLQAMLGQYRQQQLGGERQEGQQPSESEEAQVQEEQAQNCSPAPSPQEEPVAVAAQPESQTVSSEECGAVAERQQGEGVTGSLQSGSDSEDAEPSGEATVAALGMLRRRTQVALQMWEHMSQTASTPSTVLTPDGFSRLLPLKRTHSSASVPSDQDEEMDPCVAKRERPCPAAMVQGPAVC